MKTLKRVLFLCFSVLCILLPASVSADDPEVKVKVKEKEEYIGRVLLEDKKYPLSHYKVETQTGDSILSAGDKALAGLNNGLWSINKQIATFTIFAVEQLMTFDVFSKISEQVSVLSERIYDTASGTFLTLFVTIAGGVAAYRYYVNQQVAGAVKAFIGVVLVLTANLWFFSDVEKNVTWINEVSGDIEGAASSTNVLLTSDEFNSNEPADKQEGTAVLRNQLFDLMVKKPYLLLNYGTTKENKIVKEDPERINELLAFKPYSEEAKEKREKVVKEEVENFQNIYMSADYSAERFGQVLLTILSTIAVSIPVLIMAGLKFVLQLSFLAVVIFSGIPLIMSLIPAYAEKAASHFKLIVSIIMHKAILVLFIAVATGIATLIYESVKVTDGIEGFMLIVFIQVLTMWAIFKYRTEIIAVASVGLLQGNSAAERINQKTGYVMKDTANKGMELTKRVTSESMRLGGKAREALGRTGESNNQESPVRNLSVIHGGGQGSKPSANRQESFNQGQKGSNQASGTNEKGSVIPISDWREKSGEQQQGNKNEGAQRQSADSMAGLVNSAPPPEMEGNPSNGNVSPHRLAGSQPVDSISSRVNSATPQENENSSVQRQTDSSSADSMASLVNSVPPPENEDSNFYMERSEISNKNQSAHRQSEQRIKTISEKRQETGQGSAEIPAEHKRSSVRETAATSETRRPEVRKEAKKEARRMKAE